MKMNELIIDNCNVAIINLRKVIDLYINHEEEQTRKTFEKIELLNDSIQKIFRVIEEEY